MLHWKLRRWIGRKRLFSPHLSKKPRRIVKISQGNNCTVKTISQKSYVRALTPSHRSINKFQVVVTTSVQQNILERWNQCISPTRAQVMLQCSWILLKTLKIILKNDALLFSTQQDSVRKVAIRWEVKLKIREWYVLRISMLSRFIGFPGLFDKPLCFRFLCLKSQKFAKNVCCSLRTTQLIWEISPKNHNIREYYDTRQKLYKNLTKKTYIWFTWFMPTALCAKIPHDSKGFSQLTKANKSKTETRRQMCSQFYL